MMGWERFISKLPVVNKTYIYLLPIVGFTLKLNKDKLLDFTGIFLLNEDYPDLTTNEGYLHLLFTITRADTEQRLDVYFYNYRKYYPDKYTVMYIFKIPGEYKREYNAFLAGAYSKFSDDYKQSVIKYHGYKKGENGDSAIRIMYLDEKAYLSEEEEINRGLPHYQWTKIPRSQEIGRLWNENSESALRETFTKDLKLEEEVKLKSKV